MDRRNLRRFAVAVPAVGAVADSAWAIQGPTSVPVGYMVNGVCISDATLAAATQCSLINNIPSAQGVLRCREPSMTYDYWLSYMQGLVTPDGNYTETQQYAQFVLCLPGSDDASKLTQYNTVWGLFVVAAVTLYAIKGLCLRLVWGNQ